MGSGKKRLRTSYDSNRFVSVGAEERFNTIRKNTFIYEKGMNLEADMVHKKSMTIRFETCYYRTMVEELGWQEFCKTPCDSCDDIVYEFYANLPEATNGKCMVRGKKVDFTAKTINKYYNLPTYEEDEYTTFIAADINAMVVYDVLTLGRGGTFPYGTETVTATNFSREAKVWHRFIAHRLLPTTQYFQVTRDACLLLFTVLLRRKIDVGKFLFERLNGYKQKIGTKLWYPNLITGLCRKAGVKFPSSARMQPPPKPFDHFYIF